MFALVLGAPSTDTLPGPPTAPGTFTLWQLPAQTPTQMMSYILRTSGNRVAVIDGGMPGDAAYLRSFIKTLGDRVDAWVITHAHTDHFGALGEILVQADRPQICALYGSLPDLEWFRQWGDEDPARYETFLSRVAAAGVPTIEVEAGQEFTLDGVRFEVLGVFNPEITRNGPNNSSLVLRVSDIRKAVLFTGDLGVEGGNKVLAGPYAHRLQADYVQMAHHGQNGVSEQFYRHVNPNYCLWPTPLWLWNNDNGGGQGSGPWRTLEVREWMTRLHIRQHYVSFEGLYRID